MYKSTATPSNPTGTSFTTNLGTAFLLILGIALWLTEQISDEAFLAILIGGITANVGARYLLHNQPSPPLVFDSPVDELKYAYTSHNTVRFTEIVFDDDGVVTDALKPHLIPLRNWMLEEVLSGKEPSDNQQLMYLIINTEILGDIVQIRKKETKKTVDNKRDIRVMLDTLVYSGLVSALAHSIGYQSKTSQVQVQPYVDRVLVGTLAKLIPHSKVLASIHNTGVALLNVGQADTVPDEYTTSPLRNSMPVLERLASLQGPVRMLQIGPGYMKCESQSGQPRVISPELLCLYSILPNGSRLTVYDVNSQKENLTSACTTTPAAMDIPEGKFSSTQKDVVRTIHHSLKTQFKDKEDVVFTAVVATSILGFKPDAPFDMIVAFNSIQYETAEHCSNLRFIYKSLIFGSLCTLLNPNGSLFLGEGDMVTLIGLHDEHGSLTKLAKKYLPDYLSVFGLELVSVKQHRQAAYTHSDGGTYFKYPGSSDISYVDPIYEVVVRPLTREAHSRG